MTCMNAVQFHVFLQFISTLRLTLPLTLTLAVLRSDHRGGGDSQKLEVCAGGGRYETGVRFCRGLGLVDWQTGVTFCRGLGLV